MNWLSARLPWSYRFVVDWLPYMSFGSVLRFRRHHLESQTGVSNGDLLTLRMKQPFRGDVSLRRKGSDDQTFHEVVKDQVYRDLLRHVASCQTVMDLGANIGLATLYFASSYPNCRVMAVEPNPNTYSLLEMNLGSLIASGRCRIARLAVWSHEAALAGDDHGKPDHFSAFATKEVTDDAREKIAGVTFETLLAQSGFEQVDLLKVDIEGAEVELFKGRLDWLRKVNAIAIEFHSNSRKLSNFDQLMRDHGFKIVQEGSHTLVALRAQ